MLLCVSVSEAAPHWDELLDALDAVTPLVDDVAPGLAFLEMRGIAGDPASWMTRTRAVLQPFEGIRASLGAGANKIGARAAAYVADGTVCAEGGERALLAPLPLALLELEPGTIERLRLLGVERLGDVARLPHGPFVRRFGPEAARWHALACGIDTTPFVPRGHAVAIEAAMFGEGCADDEAQVLFALRGLLARIAADLERCGASAGALRLEVELEDTQTRAFDIVLALPTARERAMLDVVRAKLEGVTFPAGIVGLRVRALRLEEAGEATALFAGADFDRQAVAVTLARLESMLGEPVRQARIRNAHALEERFAYDRFVLTGTPAPRARVEDSPMLGEAIVPQLRLLAVSEIGVRVRGGEPAFVGDPPRAVLQCSGPWRIEERDCLPGRSRTTIARDEYDVLLESGELYRIYRQGSRWYLRGAYD